MCSLCEDLTEYVTLDLIIFITVPHALCEDLTEYLTLDLIILTTVPRALSVNLLQNTKLLT